MAFTSLHNILGSTAIDNTLVNRGDSANDIKSILLTNVHSAAATVSLFIANEDGNSYYILKNVSIPVASSLLLDSDDMLGFDNSFGGYALNITVGSSDKVDVLIKK